MAITRRERGWPGHYCMAHACLFRRNTLLEDGSGCGIVVSTVGALRNREGVIEEIGLERYYETMAFVARNGDPYKDADVCREVSLGCKTGIFAKSAVLLPPLVDNDADDMHEAAVAWVTDNFNWALEIASLNAQRDGD